MRVKYAMLAIAAAMVALTATGASAQELHGYVRSGIAGNGNGGGQACFGQGTPFTANGYKFRLGNECETYGELEWDQNLYKDKSGIVFKLVSMLAVVSTQQQDYESLVGQKDFHNIGQNIGFNGNDIALRQFWIGATLPQLNGAMLWAGKRYYHRNDIHMIDFYYWDPSGPGAGIDDVDLGFAKLAVAVFQSKNIPGSDANQGNFTYTGNGTSREMWRPDIRVYGIPVPGGGSLEVGLDLFIDSSPDCPVGSTACSVPNPDRNKVSPWVTVQHTQNIFGGFNKVALQYATGSAAPMSAYPQWDNTSDSRQARIVDHLVFQPIPEVSGSFVIHYGWMEKRYGGNGSYNDARVFGVGVRPAYHFGDYFKLQLELGYQALTPTTGSPGANMDTRRLFKATIAPTLVPAPGPAGPVFTRPELRLFVTYATWNVATQTENIVGQGGCPGNTTQSMFACNTSGVTFGAQAEAWW